MSFIEGVGDEVTAFAVVILIFILAATITFLINVTPHSGVGTTLPGISTPDSTATQQNIEDTAYTDNPQSNSNSDANTHCQATNVTGEECVNTSSDEDQYCRKTICHDDLETDSSSEEVQSTDVLPEVSYPSASALNDEGQSDTVDHDLNSTSPSAPVLEECPSNSEQEPTSDNGEIQIRLKYLDDSERIVRTPPTIKIGEFKRAHFAEDIANNKVIRLIFSGQLLRDNVPLHYYRITENCVVHVQILQAQTEPNNSQVSQNADLDLSHLLWPLLSAILGICWILYFKYPDFFNVMSLGMLFLFTGSFVYFYSQVQQQ